MPSWNNFWAERQDEEIAKQNILELRVGEGSSELEEKGGVQREGRRELSWGKEAVFSTVSSMKWVWY